VRVLYRGALARSLSELRRLLRVLLKEQARTTTQAGHLAAGLLSAIEGAYRVAAAAPKGLPRGYAAPVLRRMARGLVQSQPRA
jgi:TetR/AcrR family transcriptional repressor of bet genes